MFDQIFLSPKVKRSVISSNKHGIYKLPHELLDDIRPRMLESWEISGKSQNVLELLSSAQSSSQIKILSTLPKKT